MTAPATVTMPADVPQPGPRSASGPRRATLVTGASRGIGRAIAMALADPARPVFVNARIDAQAAEATCAAIRDAGGVAHAILADVSDAQAVQSLFAQVRDHGCWVHTLVNNAGIVRDGITATMPLAAWRDVLATNLDGSFLCAKAAIPSMITRRSGQILNVASVAGLRPQAGQANYAAAKAGLVALTRALARELGRYGIRVNAVAPGFIDTEMLAPLRASDRGSAMLDGVRDTQIPLARLGSAEEVAKAAAFLCSADAAYITGHVLVVDGGLSA